VGKPAGGLCEDSWFTVRDPYQASPQYKSDMVSLESNFRSDCINMVAAAVIINMVAAVIINMLAAAVIINMVATVIINIVAAAVIINMMAAFIINMVAAAVIINMVAAAVIIKGCFN
jgi:hypothetical protein